MKEKSQEGKEMLLLFANNMNHPESLHGSNPFNTLCEKNKRKK